MSKPESSRGAEMNRHRPSEPSGMYVKAWHPEISRQVAAHSSKLNWYGYWLTGYSVMLACWGIPGKLQSASSVDVALAGTHTLGAQAAEVVAGLPEVVGIAVLGTVMVGVAVLGTAVVAGAVLVKGEIEQGAQSMHPLSLHR